MAGTRMQLEDWLDDLCVRFIINLPQEDLSSVARICFQVEEAQWFYEDFIRPLDASLPSMSLRTFCLRIFQHCPLLANFSVENHTKAFEEFLEYKTRVPVRGAILLNHAMDSAVLVKAWKKGASWSFPRGKINKDEDDLDCAVREVWEETGFDLRSAGLVPTETKPKYIEIPIKQQQLRLYIFRNVPMDTNFQPQTRKEISKIQWYKLSELPTFRKKGAPNQEPTEGPQANKFYMVAPFLVPLKKWVVQQKKIDERKAANDRQAGLHPYAPVEEVVTEDDNWAAPKAAPEQRVPAIETLDGATQELQRLLKMQPSMQGLQPPTSYEDKGSALLSILQSKGNAAPLADVHPSQLPMAQGYAEIPQPQGPNRLFANQQHVPANFQQAPPAFQMHVRHDPAPWNYVQQAQAQQMQARNYMSIAEQRYSSQAPLVHPQPLPPQVQRAMFNNSVFQEGAHVSYQGAPQNIQAAYLRQQQQQQQQQHMHQHQQHLPQAVLQPQLAPHGAGAAPSGHANLTGQSMALLNAFKRVPSASNANAQMPVEAGLGVPAQMAAYANRMPQEPQPLDTSAPRIEHQRSPTELAGSFVAAPADQHRSSLLGMFTKSPAEIAAGVPHSTGADTGENAQELSPRSQPEKESLLQLTPQLRTGVSSLSASRHPSQGNLDFAAGLPIDQLSLKSVTSQGSGSHGAIQNTAPQHNFNMPGLPGGQQPPAHQVVPRGQDPRALGFPDQVPVSPKTLSQALQTSSAGPTPGSPNAGGHAQRRPDGSHNDQKRQLLSLFGKQQSLAGSLAQEGGQADMPFGEVAPRSRVASMASGTSSRLGRQTPISPADQSFLLGYLQSVTNNAAP